VTAAPVILDCDPGFDDAVAILLALACPEAIDLVAITTVCGNVGVEHTARNARMMVELAGAATPVHAGCPRPLVVAPRDAAHIHGTDGIAGVVLPAPRAPAATEHAVDLLRRRLRSAAPHSITLCAVAPLTNLAAAVVLEPAIVGAVRRLVLMGGAIGLGNVTPSAEFNMFADPHAAKIVFGAGWPIVMAPLELTHQAVTTPPRLAAIEAVGTAPARVVAAMIRGYPESARERRGGVPLHDACAVAYLVWPELMSGRHVRVDIETEGGSAGRTLVDWWHPGDASLPLVLDRIDTDGFFERLTARLARLPASRGKAS
jgi:purine nucleosidase